MRSLEIYVRKTLGQEPKLFKKNEEPEHKRFDFDAQDDSDIIRKNNEIIDMFDDLFDDKIIIKSHKGNITVFIVKKDKFKRYYHWSKDFLYGSNSREDDLDLCGLGTVDIIVELIQKYGNKNKYLL